jgi:hypothetical protein
MKAELNYKGDDWPIYSGKLRIIDQNEKERQRLLKRGLKLIGKHIPEGKTFRLHYAGNLLRCKALNKSGDISEKSFRFKNVKFLADLMIINGDYVCPFIRLGQTLRQI